MMNPQFYFLRLFKSEGRYLRISRNSCLKLRCPASLIRHINEHDYLILVGNKFLTNFVIIGLNQKPILKVGGVYIVSQRSFVDERIKFRMRQLMNKYLFTSYNVIDDSWLNVIEQYDEVHHLFS